MKRGVFWFFVFLVLVIVGLMVWSVSPDLDLMAKPNRIGVIEVRGLISDPQETLKALKTFRKDENVKAIVVRIESPGGGVGPSQEIYRELQRTLEYKPVIASLGSMAASGGYYIASATGRIIANPGTITGSIGVISYFPNLRGLFDKVGYEMITIKAGQFKDTGNPGREMTEQEKALLQRSIDETHGQFIRDVAKGRNIPEEKVREIADGRILTGETAKSLGLVDELGNFEDAVTLATSLGKIKEEPELVYAKKKSRSLLDLLLGSEMSEELSILFGGSLGLLRYQMPW